MAYTGSLPEHAEESSDHVIALGERGSRKGHIVSIHPELWDPGDDCLTWIVVFDEEKGRAYISPVDTGSAIDLDGRLLGSR